MTDKKYLNIVKHYEKCLKEHGDTHFGVDWPKKEDVNKRHRVMYEVIKEHSDGVTLLDLRCGCAHFYEYLQTVEDKNIKYSGLDISEEFIKICKWKFPKIDFYCADILENPDAINEFDYIIMNGVFTEKQDLTFDEMYEYFTKFIKLVFAKSKKGIAFNVMAKAVDWERDDLFHLPIDLFMDFAMKNLSRHLVIRSDYGLYEYTVYVYKNHSF